MPGLIVPVMAAVKGKSESAPGGFIGELMAKFPHMQPVYYMQARGPRIPGRVNWYCKEADELRARYKHSQEVSLAERGNFAAVPVEELSQIKLRLASFLRPV